MCGWFTSRAVTLHSHSVNVSPRSTGAPPRSGQAPRRDPSAERERDRPACALPRRADVPHGIARLISPVARPLLPRVHAIHTRSRESTSTAITPITETGSTSATEAPAPAISPAPTTESKTETTTPEAPRAGLLGEWGQHSMSVTLAPDGFRSDWERSVR